MGLVPLDGAEPHRPRQTLNHFRLGRAVPVSAGDVYGESELVGGLPGSCVGNSGSGRRSPLSKELVLSCWGAPTLRDNWSKASAVAFRNEVINSGAKNRMKARKILRTPHRLVV